MAVTDERYKAALSMSVGDYETARVKVKSMKIDDFSEFLCSITSACASQQTRPRTPLHFVLHNVLLATCVGSIYID